MKAAFNADPAKEPLRILICTDAAREGINLQTCCSDLVHFDLPWNPSRLEQRNGRIDRKLQPAKEVFCRYFRYEQREADIVLEALVRKTEVIQRQLGSAGQVIEKRITDRLAQGGIDRGQAEALAKAIEDETDAERLARARAEMDDEERARYERVVKEQRGPARCAGALARARRASSADELQRVVGAALARAGVALDALAGGDRRRVATFRLDPDDPAFAREPGWQDTFDDLRERPRKRGERLADWRRRAPIRAIAFEPPRLPDGRDAPEVVQVHLEHRLVRRLLSRFLSQGFQAGLSRDLGHRRAGAQPRVVLLGRLAVYGAGAARLHEEIIPVTAIWTEAERERSRCGRSANAARNARSTSSKRRCATRAPPRRWRSRASRRWSSATSPICCPLGAHRRGAARRRQGRTRQARRGRGETRWRSCWSASAADRQGRRVRSRPAACCRASPTRSAGNARPTAAIGRAGSRASSRKSGRAGAHPRLLRRAAHRLEPVGLVYLWPPSG